MGKYHHEQPDGPEELRAFVKRLLADVRALELMIDGGMIETGIRRIGAEQELFLMDSSMEPAPVNLAVLKRLDHRFTTELGKFNIEANTSPREFGGSCLRDLEAELCELLSLARVAARAEGAEILMVGIAPTLELSDMGMDSMTPLPRYYALNDALMKMRGESYQFFVKGEDELRVSHDSVMLEACNTSFQVHFQSSAEDFATNYNIAQVVTAPVLACATNSPVLFGRKLWDETRIALFEQAVDTRRATASLRELFPRVGYGTKWVDDSVLEIFREDIMRFRVLLADQGAEDPFAALSEGRVPSLSALRLHNGTVYRWNRACYGVMDGKPHLRIENRVLPSGPTPRDEVANAAFWYGLMKGVADQYGDVRNHMPFAEARGNFIAASRRGLHASINWLDGKTWPARDLIIGELAPLAREGLKASGVDDADISTYIDVIENRARTGQTGAAWMLRSLKSMDPNRSRAERTRALTRAMLSRQLENKPVHEWSLAQVSESGSWKENFMTVEQFMTTDLVTVNQDELVDLVASLMQWRDISHVPVEDAEHSLVGLVAVRNILPLVANGLPQGHGPNVPVSAVMDRHPTTISPETTTVEAIEILQKNKVSCLLVVREGKLVGLITQHDLVQISVLLMREQLGKTLRATE